jgi:group I intron endonuclease
VGVLKLPFLVYEITNTVNGKRYVGYTSRTMKVRWRLHVKDARTRKRKNKFQHAILKYGESSFSFEILYVEKTKREAVETEVLTIMDRNPEYNSTLGGEGTHGHVVSEESRELIRQNTPKKVGPDNHNYGHPVPYLIESNKRRKGIKNPKCAMFGPANPNFGKSRPEVIAAMHAAKPEVVSDETKAKQSASAVQRCQTEEGKQHVKSAGRKGAEIRWARERARKAALAQETSSSE